MSANLPPYTVQTGEYNHLTTQRPTLPHDRAGQWSDVEQNLSNITKD